MMGCEGYDDGWTRLKGHGIRMLGRTEGRITLQKECHDVDGKEDGDGEEAGVLLAPLNPSVHMHHELLYADLLLELTLGDAVKGEKALSHPALDDFGELFHAPFLIVVIVLCHVQLERILIYLALPLPPPRPTNGRRDSRHLFL